MTETQQRQLLAACVPVEQSFDAVRATIKQRTDTIAQTIESLQQQSDELNRIGYALAVAQESLREAASASSVPSLIQGGVVYGNIKEASPISAQQQQQILQGMQRMTESAKALEDQLLPLFLKIPKIMEDLSQKVKEGLQQGMAPLESGNIGALSKHVSTFSQLAKSSTINHN